MRITLLAATAAVAFAAPAQAGAGDDARSYVERIGALDDQGPQIGAVIVSLDADAAAAAAERAEAAKLPLAGRTVLVKDNIETREWPTTAGSNALADNRTNRDAPLIARLREAGGVVLGKTNLSEWANIRSTSSTSGWSAVGGLTRNPHATDRNSCGSSSGSGAAVAGGISYYNLTTDGNGSGDTFTPNSNLTVLNVLTVDTGIFNASSRTITLSGAGTNLIVNGSNEDAVPTFDVTSISAFFSNTPSPYRIGAAWAGNTGWIAGWTCNSSYANLGGGSACTSLPTT